MKKPGQLAVCAACTVDRERERRRIQWRRRRALKRGAVSEPYTVAEIAERDGYRCALCSGKVNMRLAVPHLKMPSIDHVIPLSLGGDDTRVNVQLAHWICNTRKGNRGADQLALFG